MPFRDVIGHVQLVRMLERAVARNTLPPSLIFGGPEGVGKATVAVALAERLNCERTGNPPGDVSLEDLDACGTCAPCRRIARAAGAIRAGRDRAAVDVLQWLEPDDKGSIKIDVVREVLRRAGFKPFDGRVRVAVIDGAEALEVPAQQALLRALEEPPPATRFVLVTTQPDALLPTIRSRCPQLRFAPLSAGEIARGLADRHGWSAEDASVAASLSGGSLGRALVRNEARSRQSREIATEVLRAVAASRAPMERIAAGQVLLARPEPMKGKAGGRSSGKGISRHELSARLEIVGALLRDIGVLSTRADARRLAHADLAPSLARLVPAFGGERLVRAFTVVDCARGALERNASPKIVADWLALNL